MNSTPSVSVGRRVASTAGIAALLVIAHLLGGCAPPASEDTVGGEPVEQSNEIAIDPEVAESVPQPVQDAGVLQVATSPEYAPNEFRDTHGEIVGFDIDLISAAAAVMGLGVSVDAMDFADVIPAVKDGAVDVGVSSLTVTEKRNRDVEFVTYFQTGTQWAAPVGQPLDPAYACGWTVAVQRDSLQHSQYVPKLSDDCVGAGYAAVEMVVRDDAQSAAAAVALGQAGAMAADLPVTAYEVQRSAGKLVQIGDVSNTAYYGWAVDDSSELGKTLHDAVQVLIERGDYDTVVRRWDMQHGSIDESEIRRPTPTAEPSSTAGS